MQTIRAVIYSFTLLLAVGALAQNPTNTPPSGQPQTAPPSAPPQAQPPQESPRPMQPPTIDDQVKALGIELDLTPEQQAKTKTILEDQRSQAMTIVNDSSMPREDKVQKLRTLREGTIANVRALLNDDQKRKLDQMLQTDEEQPPRRDQQAPAPQASPAPHASPTPK